MVISKRRTVSANDAKQRWGAMMRAVEEGERVIVESHGRPKVAIVPVEDLERLETLDVRQRRDDALRRLRALAERIGDKNASLSDEDVEKLVDRASREAIDDLAREGKLVFERDQDRP
ncbi:MAG TPA: type II toxin-antitoxin system prevent-host-death family antitoxin [Thermomicrobiales bacterium]|nr:type II toxin-antitoxin system prevent-host-death family antitoxin [Thermomicrobiales bacterium]